MFNKLRTRIILLLLLVSVFSILFVSIITNITVFNKFDTYMKSEQENKIGQIINLLENNYESCDGWTNENLYNISLSPLIKDFDILIKDSDDNPIFKSSMESDMMRHHRKMMKMMGKGMGQGRNSKFNGDEDYRTKSYDLKIDGKKIGTLEVGYIGPFTISERDIEFTKGINKSIIYGALISIIIAIVLGMYFSKIISKPIIKVTDAANDITKGNLDTKLETSNNITEVKELSNSINHLSKSLKNQQILRKQLTRDMAHELRTPLSVLQSHIEAIIDGIWEPSKERMYIFREEINRLINLVEQLKYLTDIENHKITLDKGNHNLSKTIEDIVKNFKIEFDNKGVSLKGHIEKDLYINFDKNKISQALINLISNALKFTDEGGKVLVTLKKDTNNAIIEIEDTGIGIKKEDIDHIFERLYRGDKSRNRKTGGAGIGLTIVKEIIEAHKGTISVESEMGKGSIFTITIPNK